jgi:hypothetical protein
MMLKQSISTKRPSPNRPSLGTRLLKWTTPPLTLLTIFFLLATTAHAQFTGFGQTPPPQKQSKKDKHTEEPKPGEKPSIPPSFTIPVEPLGFTAPGPIYLGQRSSMASLDFLDENHLLFTFRVPGLLKRDSNYDDGKDSGERQVRALVIALPSGSIEADELWTLHDHDRYLWILSDGHFLLRDGNELKQGDPTLKLKPVLRFPGPLASISVDPLSKYLVTNSHEPAVKPAPPTTPTPTPTTQPNPPLKPQQGPGLSTSTNNSLAFESISSQPGTNNSGTSDSNTDEIRPSTTPTTTAKPTPPPAPTPERDLTTPEMVVRILERASGKVLLVSRVRAAVQLPINSTGYLEVLRDHGLIWVLNLYHFDGGVTRIGEIQSSCLPTLEFVAEDEIVSTVCADNGNLKLIALTIAGQHLWELSAPNGTIWPHLVRSSNGLRVARESLAVNRSVTASTPLDPDDIKAQRVSVYDAINGHVVLTASASPILDAGGNLAISPNGKRVAVLHAGNIEFWDLDPPPNPVPTQK